MNVIQANARSRVEQDIDLVPNNMKLIILGQPNDENRSTTDSRYKHCKGNENRIILKDGLLFRKYFGETGSVKYYQILIPKQLVNGVLRSLHGEFGRHPGFTKTIIAYRQIILFLKNGAINQGVGHVMWAMYHRIKKLPQLHHPSPAKPQWTYYCTRRCHANWFGARITSTRWLWKHCGSSGSVLPLTICLPAI